MPLILSQGVLDVMYEIAGLEAKLLQELKVLLEKREQTTDEDRARIRELTGFDDLDRVRTAFLFVTTKGGVPKERRRARR